MHTSVIDSFIRKYLKLVSINNKKLKYQHSRTETMLLMQILFHSVAISHPKLCTDGILIEKVSLITLREWNKQIINIRKSKYEVSQVHYTVYYYPKTI